MDFLTILPKGLDIGEKLGFFGKIKSFLFWGKIGGIALLLVIAVIIGLLIYVLIKKKNK